jgi:chitinase
MAVSRRWNRFFMIFAAVIAVAACNLPPPAASGRQTEVSPAEPDRRWFGGYLDVTQVPALRLADSPRHGTVTTVLSFINSAPAKPCEPSWGGYYDLQQAEDKLHLGAQVEGFRQGGNDVAVSFGGQLGMELAAACTDSDALVRAYGVVIAKYGLGVVDLDIEGKGLEDHTAAGRRAGAMARVQAGRPADAPLKVWLTLPASADGLTPGGEYAVQSMLEAGVELAGVNIMTMNFGPLVTGQTMLTAAINAAEGTHRALAAFYEKAGNPLEAAVLWKKIGLTPMIGVNDVRGQVFTLEHAEGLNRFASERSIGRMSMWSLNRDTGCDSSSDGQGTEAASPQCSGVKQEPGRFAKLLGTGYPR